MLAFRPITLLLMLVFCPNLSLGASAKEARPAKLKISGYGLLGNWELKRMLKTLELAGKKPEFYDATFAEDAALILSAHIKQEGYLQPTVLVRLWLESGGRIEVSAEDFLENPLPRPLRVTKIQFKIHKGVLYHYKTIEFDGLE